jgi:hypothetical protein
LRYLRLTGRPPELVDLVEAYTKEQGLWHEPEFPPVFTDTMRLDLSTVVPSIAGPSRPQDHVPLAEATLPSAPPSRRPSPLLTDHQAWISCRCTSARPALRSRRRSRSRPATHHRRQPVSLASAHRNPRPTGLDAASRQTGHTPP